MEPNYVPGDMAPGGTTHPNSRIEWDENGRAIVYRKCHACGQEMRHYPGKKYCIPCKIRQQKIRQQIYVEKRRERRRLERE